MLTIMSLYLFSFLAWESIIPVRGLKPDDNTQDNTDAGNDLGEHYPRKGTETSYSILANVSTSEITWESIIPVRGLKLNCSKASLGIFFSVAWESIIPVRGLKRSADGVLR